jgi:hypothetical protein
MNDASPQTGVPARPRTKDRRRSFMGSGARRWFMVGAHPSVPAQHHTYPWWKVMCLTGVDYFSTLGYQPGIAYLAAGALSPVATLVLVLVTLFVALPVYREVARRSPNGQGSILMLEELLPRWKGKVFVLVLLGFALTDFVITITLSAADATAHLIQNPMAPAWIRHPMGLTLVLLAMLGAVFMKGFREAIGMAVAIVAVYLGLNVVVLGRCFYEISLHPGVFHTWREALFTGHANPLAMIGLALVLFPRLALGLSGFETGVAVMPLVRGDRDDEAGRPRGRIRNTRKLLLTAAVIMSVFLIGSSLATTLLIPAAAFRHGGAADGRALAYLAHHLFGHAFGTVYDIATVIILWFAGASAMAGLLNLVPRYLPPYGMAPNWARATRPLVLVFTVVAFAVTWMFNADVDAQGGAYATGVLFLMTSASVAVTIAHKKHRRRNMWLAMTCIFAYTTFANIVERPEGIKIASFFILAIIVSSMISRAIRSIELRIDTVRLDEGARSLLEELAPHVIRIIAHRPDSREVYEYDEKERQAREDHSLDRGEQLLFLEVDQGDVSDFQGDLEVRGERVGRHRVLRCKSPAVPNAIAALLLHLKDLTRTIPHAYFGWIEGNPVAYAFRYVALGEGDTAPVTREILRQAIREPLQRPRIHVG